MSEQRGSVFKCVNLNFRAHTIVKIQFNQKLPKSNGAGTTTKKSEINLVDLAGR